MNIKNSNQDLDRQLVIYFIWKDENLGHYKSTNKKGKK